MSSKKFIDVEKILETKNPRLKKRLPKFLVRYLKRILHQKEINRFLEENKNVKNQDFCKEVVKFMNIDVEVKNLERIPKQGKIVLVMNHPLGGMDAMILVDALANHRKDLKFIVNDILLNLEGLKELFVGVNKVGKNKTSLKSQIDMLFASEEAVCVFPAGLVSRKVKGEVTDLAWKKTFVTYSRKHNRTIIPIHIDGRLSNFFYRLSKFRKFIGIKANIEMLYLANELFKQKNRKMKFTIGKPIDSKLLDSSKKDVEIANEIRRTVYALNTRK
jgi:putative hemolysin